MPNRPAHDTGIAVLTIVALSMQIETPIIAGLLFGIPLTPDLDLSQNGIWKLYGKWFKHRGTSHVPVIGTLSRVFYLFPIIALFLIISGTEINVTISAKVLSGLILSDILHLLMDITWSTIKRKLR